ncbi:MAG TPA: HAD-IB family hydrolase [Lacunisphaera sp.]|nr:HAD-IB family hydrolase [Lacunisphaera sp.]
MKLAVFDFDGTVLRGNTWHLVFSRQLRRPARAPWLLTALAIRRARLASAEWLQDRALAAWRGRPRSAVEEQARAFYATRLRPRLREAALTEISRHRAQGHEVVVVSAAWDVLLAPFAAEFGLRHWAGTPVAFDGDRCAGRLATPLLRGEAKAAWLRRTFAGQAVDWAGSHAYGDEASDLPMLRLVGSPWFVAASEADVPAGAPAGTRRLTWV